MRSSRAALELLKMHRSSSLELGYSRSIDSSLFSGNPVSVIDVDPVEQR